MLDFLVLSLQYELKTGRAKHRGKTSFVEHRTFLHLYHSFHRLWIFLVMMFQVFNPVSGFRLFVMLFFDIPQKTRIIKQCLSLVAYCFLGLCFAIVAL